MDKRTEFSSKATVTDEHLLKAFKGSVANSRAEDFNEGEILFEIRFVTADGKTNSISCETIEEMLGKFSSVMNALIKEDVDFVIQVARQTGGQEGTLTALQQRQLPQEGTS